jgi:hypothetical protein
MAGVNIGLTTGFAAGSVGNRGPADAGGRVGALGIAPTGMACSGTMGNEVAMSDAGGADPGTGAASSKTDRRAVTYGPATGSRGATGLGATGASAGGRSPRRGKGSSGATSGSGAAPAGARWGSE